MAPDQAVPLARRRESPCRSPAVAAVACAALAVVLSACGGSGNSAGRTTTTSSTTTTTGSGTTTQPGSTTTVPGSVCGLAAQPPPALVSSTPEPCTVRTWVGATLQLALAGGFRWDDPTSDSTAVAIRHVTRATDGGGLGATLVASSPGTAVIQSTGGVLCPPGSPCPALARLWSLRVVVATTVHAPIVVSATETDGGRSYALRTGDRLQVHLAGPDGYTWSEPASSDAAVLRRGSATGGTTATGEFTAVAAGHATVSATDSPNCYPQCLSPSRLFQVAVSISG